MEDQIEEVQDKAPVIGKFKTKGKFISFMSATQGKVRLFRETAFIEGSQLSGMLDKAKFKITICDEATIDFEEVDTNLADEAMIKRLIEQIEESEVNGYAQKFIASGYKFTDVDGHLCYLEVQHEKPIDRLRSIFEEEPEQELSEKGLSALDLLFGDTDEDFDTEFSEEDAEIIAKEIESPAEPNEKLKTASESYLEESFRKMNEQKVNELKERIDKTEKEINKSDFELKTAESKLKKSKEELKVLQTRLETMTPPADPNGIVFNVSEEKKHDTGLDETTKHVADKIADLMGLKKEVLFEQLTSGYYEIRLTDKREDYTVEDTEKEVELKKIIHDVKSIDVDGKFDLSMEGGVLLLTYRGELNWHQITSKLIRLGFEQDEEFDKFAGSNSYTSKFTERGTEEDDTVDVNDILNIAKSLPSGEIDDEDEEDEDEEEEDAPGADYHTKELKTFDEPTDIVIWTEPSIGYYGDADVVITDDYATLELRAGGKFKFDMETAGFATIDEFKRYKKFLEEEGEEGLEYLGGTEAVFIPDFVGTVSVGINLGKGGYATDFDPSGEDLMHQDGQDGQVFLDFPEGTEMIFIEDHDLDSLKGFLRDKKIQELGIK